MPKTKTKTHALQFADRYLDLVRAFPLRPIRGEDELDAAIAVVNSLVDLDKRTPDEDDYLDVLSDLVEKYEAKHHPIPSASGVDMLRYLIEIRETTQAALADASGIATSTISSILSGKRAMSRRHIEALARHFKVSPALFIDVERGD
jgi:HTH-type transcriptional regulator/antitoxin HigA